MKWISVTSRLVIVLKSDIFISKMALYFEIVNDSVFHA